MKKSIAIWYQPKKELETKLKDAELHFNLWKLPSKRAFIRFLDIGIKLNSTTDVEELKLYLPCTLKDYEITDIVGNFITNSELISTIFNEYYHVSSEATSNLSVLTNLKDETEFSIYKLESSKISKIDKHDGSIVSIKLPKCDSKIYIRLRISGKFVTNLSAIQKPSNSILQSAFSKVELIDFRVNEARDLNNALLEEIESEQRLSISKVHFFFVCSSSEDFYISHTPYLNCRKLETSRWKPYIGNDTEIDNKGGILAYHWKDKNIPDYSVLVKTKFESNNWITILIYVGILLLLSIIFNLLSNYIFEVLKPLIFNK